MVAHGWQVSIAGAETTGRGHPLEWQGPAIRGGGRWVDDGAVFGLGTMSRVPDLSSGARQWGTTLYLA